MRFRFVRRQGVSSEAGAGQAFLTIGREYVVLAVLATSSDCVQFLLLDDHSEQPGWHPASDFDLTSDEVPSNWRLRVGVAGIGGHVEIAAAPWLEDGFFNDYWGDGDVAAISAQETFRRELEVILRESQ